MKYITLSILMAFTIISLGLIGKKKAKYVGVLDENQSVVSVLELLGEQNPNKPNLSIPGATVENGKSIVLEGFSHTVNGSRLRKQSKHFVCTSCHNIKREDPDLAIADPDARLPYVVERNLPFLQGTTFAGIVNRTKFYNGDYYKKYGDLVNKTRNNIREAIQLCAVACSQGRELDDWEIESILAYFWTLEWKMSDLDLSDEDYRTIKAALEMGGQQEKRQAVTLIKSKYLDYSPATFIAPPDNRREGNKLKGEPSRGKQIYELSCLHCHEDGRYSFFVLDNSGYSFRFLDKHFPRYTRYSPYQVIRWGTSPATGKKAYMPHYTKEKMSRQQIEDLRAYVHEMARGGAEQ